MRYWGINTLCLFGENRTVNKYDKQLHDSMSQASRLY